MSSGRVYKALKLNLFAKTVIARGTKFEIKLTIFLLNYLKFNIARVSKVLHFILNSIVGIYRIKYFYYITIYLN